MVLGKVDRLLTIVITKEEQKIGELKYILINKIEKNI